MKIQQKQYRFQNWRDVRTDVFSEGGATLVLVFGAPQHAKDSARYDEIRQWYPDATIVTASTAGEILGSSVYDDSLAVTALQFETCTLKLAVGAIADIVDSRLVGSSLAAQLNGPGLRHVMIFSDGLLVSGSEIVRGLQADLAPEVSVTGGLAGDGPRFEATYIGADTPGLPHQIAAVGIYGQDLVVGHGSYGGWDQFGIERMITKSEGSTVYELDGRPILDLYKEYLGDQAQELPGSGLLFPLSIYDESSTTWVVRTLLSVNEEDHSIRFAGEMPHGTKAKLMKANFDRLIEGAQNAAIMSRESSGDLYDIAILVSCVGRKLVLKQRTNEELEAARSAIGEQCAMTGFYSYGEIAPATSQSKMCELHNQTMTITLLGEKHA